MLVINPVGHSRWDEKDKEIYEGFASPEVEVDVKSLPRGPATVESPEAHAEVIPLVVELGKKFKDEYDGFIVNCFLDPGVDLLRRIIRKPVVGPCEASFALASMIGGSIGVLSVGGRDTLWMIEERIKNIGYSGWIVGVDTIGLGVLELDVEVDETVKRVVERSKTLIDMGAETIVLGCTGLSGLLDRVSEQVEVPIIDPSGAAIKVLEGLLYLGVHLR